MVLTNANASAVVPSLVEALTAAQCYQSSLADPLDTELMEVADHCLSVVALLAVRPSLCFSVLLPMTEMVSHAAFAPAAVSVDVSASTTSESVVLVDLLNWHP